jgi:hypothetical protein
VQICWGLDSSSVQHFYYSADGGSTWLEITEVVICEVDAVTSTTIFTLTTGSAPFNDTISTVDDYYNHWQAYYHDVSTPANDSITYVSDYTGSTKTLTCLYACTGVANGDKIVLMRFPLWHSFVLQDVCDGTISDFDDQKNIVNDSSNFKPTIVQRKDAISVYTGRRKNTVHTDRYSGVLDPKWYQNFWFGYVETGNLFDDSNLSYTGYHAERKYLFRPRQNERLGGFATVAAAAETQDPLPDNKIWKILYSFIYDGYQESPIFWQVEDCFATGDGDLVDASALTNQKLTVAFSIADATWPNYLEEYWPDGISRRRTAIRIYLAQAEKTETALATFKPVTPFYLVREISLTDTTWAGTGPYTYAAAQIHILGADWDAGKTLEAELVHGFFSKARINADLATVLNGREVCASFVAGDSNESGYRPFGVLKAFDDFTESESYLIYSAINLALRNTPDLFPETDIRDMAEDGIYKIYNIKPIGDLLAVFGANKVVLLDRTETVRSFEEKGVNGYWSVNSIGNRMFWGNQYSIYDLIESGTPNEIGFPIRDTWQALSAANRQTSIAAYDPVSELFLLHSQSGATFINDVKKGSWRKYSSAKNWKWLTTGVDGEVLASDGSDIYQLFAGTPTETLTATYQKDFEFDTEVSITQFWLNYKSTTAIKVYIYDLENSETIPITEALLFLPQTVEETQKERLTIKAQRIRVKIEKQTSTDQDWVINSYSIFGTPQQEERDAGQTT